MLLIVLTYVTGRMIYKVVNGMTTFCLKVLSKYKNDVHSLCTRRIKTNDFCTLFFQSTIQINYGKSTFQNMTESTIMGP